MAHRCPCVLPWSSGVEPVQTLTPWSSDSSGPFLGRPPPRALRFCWLLPSTQPRKISFLAGEEKRCSDPGCFLRVILLGLWGFHRGFRLWRHERWEEAAVHLPAKTWGPGGRLLGRASAGHGKERNHVNLLEEKKYWSVLENTLLPHFVPNLGFFF